jgi:hypothetical protein
MVLFWVESWTVQWKQGRSHEAGVAVQFSSWEASAFLRALRKIILKTIK